MVFRVTVLNLKGLGAILCKKTILKLFKLCEMLSLDKCWICNPFVSPHEKFQGCTTIIRGVKQKSVFCQLQENGLTELVETLQVHSRYRGTPSGLRTLLNHPWLHQKNNRILKPQFFQISNFMLGYALIKAEFLVWFQATMSNFKVVGWLLSKICQKVFFVNYRKTAG